MFMGLELKSCTSSKLRQFHFGINTLFDTGKTIPMQKESSIKIQKNGITSKD